MGKPGTSYLDNIVLDNGRLMTVTEERPEEGCGRLCDAIPVSFDPCGVTLFQLGRGVRRRSTASGRAARWRCGSLIGH